MILINFKLSRRDIFFANLIALFQQPYMVVLLILCSAFICRLNWMASSSENLIVRVLTTSILCIPPFLIASGGISLFLFFMGLSRNNETILAEQKWEINDEMLISESKYARSEIKWIALRRIIPVGNYMFLYLSQMGACIIPRRAFVSDQDWKAFVELCRSKLKRK